jgi:hypothetical protein
MEPLVRYFEKDSDAFVEPGIMRHAYYGVPTWLMKTYLEELGAEELDENVMGWGECRAVISEAEPNVVGSLVVGGSIVEFSGCEGKLEAMLEELEWKTLRIGA